MSTGKDNLAGMLKDLQAGSVMFMQQKKTGSARGAAKRGGFASEVKLKGFVEGRGADLAEDGLRASAPAIIAKSGLVGVVPGALLAQPLLRLHPLEGPGAPHDPACDTDSQTLHCRTYRLRRRLCPSRAIRPQDGFTPWSPAGASTAAQSLHAKASDQGAGHKQWLACFHCLPKHVGVDLLGLSRVFQAAVHMLLCLHSVGCCGQSSCFHSAIVRSSCRLQFLLLLFLLLLGRHL